MPRLRLKLGTVPPDRRDVGIRIGREKTHDPHRPRAYDAHAGPVNQPLGHAGIASFGDRADSTSATTHVSSFTPAAARSIRNV